MVVSRIEPVDKLHKSAPYGIIGLKERGIHDGTNRRADADDSNGSLDLIPDNHLLRKIDARISFSFIYDLLTPFYSAVGRPSVDPVSMFKMLLVGYLYGIKSERRLVQEIQLNIAYRWFCGFELSDKIPDHSTFSKTRIRKWNESQLFSKVFVEIVRQCIEAGLVDGKEMAADGSYLPAQVSRNSWVDLETTVEQSMFSYLDALDQELSEQPGFKKPPIRTVKKRLQRVRQIQSVGISITVINEAWGIFWKRQ